MAQRKCEYVPLSHMLLWGYITSRIRGINVSVCALPFSSLQSMAVGASGSLSRPAQRPAMPALKLLSDTAIRHHRRQVALTAKGKVRRPSCARIQIVPVGSVN